jgi:23S rRNA pseudouridine2605 synthase
MSKKPFGKFIQQKEKGSKKKEMIRQEKKAVRQETKAYFDQKKAEVKAQREQHRAQNAEYRNLRSELKGQKPEEGSKKLEVRSKKTAYESNKPAHGKKQEDTSEWLSGRDAEREAAAASSKPAIGPKSAIGNRQSAVGSPKAATGSRQPVTGNTRPASTNKKTLTTSRASAAGNKPAPGSSRVAVTKNTTSSYAGKPTAAGGKQPEAASVPKAEEKNKRPANVIPLNKFLAHSGVSARREAAEIVKSGKVMVNGKVVMEPGFKVSERDEVKVNGKQINIRKNMVYILVNKPKDFITTTEDPQGRKTVLDLIKHATDERVYPVGRLDRNTTGVLLLTNDGELAQKLTHPSYEIKKIYEVKLDKPLVKKDFDTILNGIELEDGMIAPDVLAYADSKDKSVIGIEIHSGRNRIVRRIFEHMGYDVRNLDRVMYANLTKKNVDRGKWRLLNEKEVRLLKYLNSSFTNNKPKKPARG